LLWDVAAGRIALDILCIEGAIARGPAETGRFRMLSGCGQSLMHWIGQIAVRARHVVAVGTCATSARATAEGGNPTDAMGLQYDGAGAGGLLGAGWRSASGALLINGASCPRHPGRVRSGGDA